MSEASQESNTSFVSCLNAVYTELTQQLKHEIPTGPVQINNDGRTFLAVWNGQRGHLDPILVRRGIGEMLQLENIRIVQVVGDSGTPFSEDGLIKARDVILALTQDVAASEVPTVIEYGHTASKHDANWVVNDLITTTPKLDARVIGNVVHTSIKAVEEHGAESIDAVRGFVLAYDETETAFGDDLWLSDDVMDAEHGDSMICLEGGPQAFTQAVSVCLRGVLVVAITELRDKNDISSSGSPRFSAATLLRVLHAHWQTALDEAKLMLNKSSILHNAADEYVRSCLNLDQTGDQKKYKTISAALNAILNKPEALRNVQMF